MGKKGLVVFLLVILFNLSSFKSSAEVDQHKIGVGWEGDSWLALDEMGLKLSDLRGLTLDEKKQLGAVAAKNLKLLLLKGIVEGIAFGRSPDSTEYYLNTSFDFYIQALDQFYSDYKNRKIYIVWAMRVISLEIKGIPKEEIETHLARLREKAVSCPNELSWDFPCPGKK